MAISVFAQRIRDLVPISATLAEMLSHRALKVTTSPCSAEQAVLQVSG